MFKIFDVLKSNVWKSRIIALMAILLIGLNGRVTEEIKIYRVGIICGANPLLATITGFKSKMAELGYLEGKNILYDIQKTDNNEVEEQRFINRFIGEKVDLIIAFPNETAIIAKILTRDTDIPVIFAYSAIEGTNLVNNLKEPGGNITGVRYPILELTAKRLELLLEFDPTIKSIWVAYDPSYPLISNALLSLRPAAQSRGITLVEIPVSEVDEVRADLAKRDQMTDIGVDAILIMPDMVTQSAPSWKAITNFAEKHKLPISAIFYEELHSGALFYYGNDYFQVGGTAAILAAKIFQGTPAGRIPVASPEGYLSINLIRAKALDITVPNGLLKQAVELVR